MDAIFNLQANVPFPIWVTAALLLAMCVWRKTGLTVKRSGNGVSVEVTPPEGPRLPQKAKNRGHKKSKRTRKKRK